MNKLLPSLAIVAVCAGSAAADTIHRRGADHAVGTVISVTKDRVEYRPAAGGPPAVLRRRDVLRIEYDNGFVDSFHHQTVKRRDGTTLVGTITGVDETGLTVVPRGTSTPFVVPAADITTIELASLREFTHRDLFEASFTATVDEGIERLNASKRNTIRTYGDRVMVRATLAWRHLALRLNDRRYAGGLTDLRPAVKVYGAVAVTWRDITLSYGMSAADLSKKLSVVPSYYDSQVQWSRDFIAVESWLQHYRGYRANDAVFNRQRSGTSMKSWAGGLTASLLFSGLRLNRQVSLGASFQQTARQLVSGFVYGPFVSVEYFRFSSRDPFKSLLDPVFVQFHQPMEFYGCRGLRGIGVSLGAQAGGTIVWRGWYLTGLYMLGVVPFEIRLQYMGWRKRDLSAGNWRMSLRLAGGFNGERVFAGVFAIGDILNVSYRGKSGIFETEKQNAGFFAGCRI